MSQLTPSTTLNSTARAPIVDKNGMATWSFLKVLQGWDVSISNGLSPQGQLIGTAAQGNTAIASTDQLIDGTGSPLAGGKAAYTALLASRPAKGDVLEYDGIAWVPTALPAQPVVVTKLVAGTNVTISPTAGTGVVTINVAGAPSGGVLTATASVAVGSSGGTITQFIAIAGGVTNSAAFVAQLQSPGIPFSGGGSSGFTIDAVFVMIFSAGGCSLSTTVTPPSGSTFTAGNYLVNIKAIL